MSKVKFMFPAVRADVITPTAADTGISIADANIVTARYYHGDSHALGGYDELRLDTLAIGSAVPGQILLAGASGTAQFADVPQLLLARGQYAGRRVRCIVPTVVDRITLPQTSKNGFEVTATVTARGDCGWRLYDADKRHAVAEGQSNQSSVFVLHAPNEPMSVELQVWSLDECGTSGTAFSTIEAKLDEFRLTTVGVFA